MVKPMFCLMKGSNRLFMVVDEYSEISRNVAAETNAQLCDIRKAFLDYLRENNAEDKDAGVPMTDRIHLNAAGNRLVTEQMLKAIGEELR